MFEQFFFLIYNKICESMNWDSFMGNLTKNHQAQFQRKFDEKVLKNFKKIQDCWNNF